MLQAPIVILGIHQRSGTNYVARLIAAHPDCALVPGEGFYVAKSELLQRYFDALYGAWPVAPDRAEARSALLRHLGDGLLAYQAAGAAGGKRIVSKTPSVDGLEGFFDLFPDAYLVIVVRDGRALVESHTRTFHSSWEGMTRRWRAAARTILDFDRANRDRGLRYRIVRYEDLYQNTRPALEELLDGLGLERERYPFEQIDDLPVFGSSETAEGGEVHWRPVQPDASFNPLERSAHWSESQLRRFERLAGKELRAFGYDTPADARTGPTWVAGQWLRDGRWRVRAALVGALRRGGIYHHARNAYDRIRSQERVQRTVLPSTAPSAPQKDSVEQRSGDRADP